MRKTLLAVTVILALTLLAPVYAEASTLGGRWLVDGGGFAEKSVLRVSLRAGGTLDIKSDLNGSAEYVSGYEVWGELNASELRINTWSYHDEYELPASLVINSFNPTSSEPFYLPPFAIDGLTYRVVLTSVNSGTVNISGFIEVDTVGQCEINADCAIWRQGTSKPDIPDAASGCDSGAAPLASALLVFAVFRRARCSS
ncbi:MAG: hypothetical protein LBQ19_04780 [Synergistaceae bacterium]|nr:hypothetical protein [Synergistaceae bacterium]